jgi:hypothetical protein
MYRERRLFTLIPISTPAVSATGMAEWSSCLKTSTDSCYVSVAFRVTATVHQLRHLFGERHHEEFANPNVLDQHSVRIDDVDDVFWSLDPSAR